MTIGTLGIFALGLSEGVAFNAITDGKDELVVRMNSEVQKEPLDLSAKEKPLDLSTKQRHEMLGPIRKPRPIRNLRNALLSGFGKNFTNQGTSVHPASSGRAQDSSTANPFFGSMSYAPLSHFVSNFSYQGTNVHHAPSGRAQDSPTANRFSVPMLQAPLPLFVTNFTNQGTSVHPASSRRAQDPSTKNPSLCWRVSERPSNEEFLKRIIQERNDKAIGENVKGLSPTELPQYLWNSKANDRNPERLRYYDRNNKVHFSCPFNDGLIFGIVFLIFLSNPHSTVPEELLPPEVRQELNNDQINVMSAKFMPKSNGPLPKEVEDAILLTRQFFGLSD